MIYPRTIYAIKHNVTKRMYIGSSKDVKTRYQSHIHRLRSGKHPIEDMQEDFSKYGEDFSVYILEEVTINDDRKNEYKWMRKYNTFTRGVGYNYKDKEREILHLKNSVPLKAGLPDPFVDITDSNVRSEYIRKINEFLLETEDIALLDFILQLAVKSKAYEIQKP